MVETTTTLITGDLGAAFDDGLTLDNTVVTTAFTTGTALQSATGAASTVLFQAYDVDGTAYKTFMTLTSNNTPTLGIVAPSGGTIAIDGASIGAVTPGSGAFTTITTTGAAVITGNLTSSGYMLRSVGNALTAVGTNRATALQLAKEVNNVTTAGSGTGVILPVGVAGMRVTVFSAGANAIQVYATASETIDTVAGSTGVPLTNTKRADFFFVAANTWVSAQLGVVSA